MDTPVNGFKSFYRKGTKFVLLPVTSQHEGHPLYAQIRRLTGKDLGIFLTHQSQLQNLKEWETLPEQQRQEVISQSLIASRDVVLRVLLRVIEVIETEVISLTVSSAPIGEHGENEISVDYLESDYATLLIEISALSFPKGGPNAGGSFRGEGSLSDSRLPRETVQSIAE